jgi:hypothetical protein
VGAIIPSLLRRRLPEYGVLGAQIDYHEGHEEHEEDRATCRVRETHQFQNVVVRFTHPTDFVFFVIFVVIPLAVGTRPFLNIA